MSAPYSLLLQYLVIAVAVLASVCFVLHSQFPALTRRVRLRCALLLLRAPYGWLQAWGRRIAPITRTRDQVCGACTACDSTPRR